MALEPTEVAKIAHLARIAIDPDSIPAYTERLSNILDMMNQLQSANTDGITPMAHPMDAMQRLREDAVTETNQRDTYQRLAPATESGLYLVPKVIE